MRTQRVQKAAALLPAFVCFISMIVISALGLQAYRQASFSHISGFCRAIISEHPETETQVLSSLKSYCASEGQGSGGEDFLKQYGYAADDFSAKIQNRFVWILAAAFLVSACAFFLSGLYLRRCSRMRIDGLTKYLEQVNAGAAGTVLQPEEDDFSHLQDEIYKTVTTLHQTRDAAVRAKADFADNLANIAHQLKTPVTAASLSLQLWEKEAPAVYAGQIKKQLKRLMRLEEALLTLSRIDAGALQMERSRVDLYTVLNLAADNLDDLLRKEQISVLIPDRGCVEIIGDPEWTMEALMNLMKNCMEHSPAGGRIHCEYSCNPLYAEIVIRDEGEGFAAEDIPHLFERFYRGREAAGSGIGIGLSLARSVIELQNGVITARNWPEGGACFEIRFYCH